MSAALLFYAVLFVWLVALPALVIWLFLAILRAAPMLWQRFKELVGPLTSRLARPLVGPWRSSFPRSLAFLASRFDPRAPWGLAATIALLGVGVGAFLVGDILHHMAIAERGALVTLDARLHNSLPLVRSAPMTAFMLGATELGGPLFLWPLSIGLSALAFARGKRRLAATFLLAIASASILSYAIKLLVSHPRPIDALIHARESSFPSGHTLGAAVVYGLLAFAVMTSGIRSGLRRSLTLALILLIVSIGISRLYLGVHWPSDLLGSLAVALSCLACLVFFLQYPGRITRLEALSSASSTRIAGMVGWISIAAGFLIAAVLFGRTRMAPVGPPAIAEALDLSHLREQLPEHLPARSEDLFGRGLDPIALLLVGTRDELGAAFQRAGWTPAELPTPDRVVREVFVTADRHADPTGTAMPAYFANRPQTLTFGKASRAGTKAVTRVWQTAYCVAPECRILWVATTSIDRGVFRRSEDLRPAPEGETQRTMVVADLATAGAQELGTLVLL
ncbi:MAG: phosphatase PAP2 family protein, partial [Thermoanaerobaculia bacterium]